MLVGDDVVGEVVDEEDVMDCEVVHDDVDVKWEDCLVELHARLEVDQSVGA